MIFSETLTHNECYVEVGLKHRFMLLSSDTGWCSLADVLYEAVLCIHTGQTTRFLSFFKSTKIYFIWYIFNNIKCWYILELSHVRIHSQSYY